MPMRPSRLRIVQQNQSYQSSESQEAGSSQRRPETRFGNHASWNSDSSADVDSDEQHSLHRPPAATWTAESSRSHPLPNNLHKDTDLAAVDLDDYADPRNLPYNVHYRHRRQLRGLEYGTYRSALHDVVKQECCDLSMILLGWEKLKKELSTQEQATADPMLNSSPSDTTPSVDPSLRTIGKPLYGVPTLPSSLSLSQMAYWPIHADLQPFIAASCSVEEEILKLISEASRSGGPKQNRGEQNASVSRGKRLRSAYEAGAPLAPPQSGGAAVDSNMSELDPALFTEHENNTGHESSSVSPYSTDEQLGFKFDDLEDQELSPQTRSLSQRLTQYLDGAILQLASKVEKSPLPPIDYWEKKKRQDLACKRDPLNWIAVLNAVELIHGKQSNVCQRFREEIKKIYVFPDQPEDNAFKKSDTRTSVPDFWGLTKDRSPEKILNPNILATGASNKVRQSQQQSLVVQRPESVDLGIQDRKRSSKFVSEKYVRGNRQRAKH